MMKTKKQIQRAKEYQKHKENYLKNAHRYYKKHKKWILLLQSQWKWNNPKKVKAHYVTEEKRRKKLRKNKKWQKKQEQYRIRSRRKLGR